MLFGGRAAMNVSLEGWRPLPGTYVIYREERYLVRHDRQVPRQTMGHTFDSVFDLVGPNGKRAEGVELSELRPVDSQSPVSSRPTDATELLLPP
jgi:hypothetical protein